MTVRTMFKELVSEGIVEYGFGDPGTLRAGVPYNELGEWDYEK